MIRPLVVFAAAALAVQPSLAHAQSAPQPKAAPPAAAKSAPPPAGKAAAERKEIKLSEKVLKTYVGEYEMSPERTLNITLETGSLWGEPTNSQKRQIFAESATKFFLKDLEVELTFLKDAKGNVTGLKMNQAGRPERELKKIK